MPTKFKSHANPRCEVGLTHRDDKHRRYDKKRYADPVLSQVARFRSSRRWQVCRRVHVGRNPLCVDPFNVHPLGLPGRDVHHVIPLATCVALGHLDGLGTDPLNLRTLCTRCHARVEAMAEHNPQEAVAVFMNHEFMAALVTGYQLQVGWEKNVRYMGEIENKLHLSRSGEANTLCSGGANTKVPPYPAKR